MLVLRIVGKLRSTVVGWGPVTTSTPNFIQIFQCFSNLIMQTWMDGQAGFVSPISVNFVHIMQRTHNKTFQSSGTTYTRGNKVTIQIEEY
jgi:hypothetical protein